MSELTDISHSVISTKGKDKNLSGREITLDRTIFDIGLKIKRMLEATKSNPLPPAPMPVVVQAPPQSSGINYLKSMYPPLMGICCIGHHSGSSSRCPSTARIDYPLQRS